MFIYIVQLFYIAKSKILYYDYSSEFMFKKMTFQLNWFYSCIKTTDL